MEDPVVILERNLYGHPLAGLLREKQFGKILLKYGWEKVSNWDCLFVHREKGLFFFVDVDDTKLTGKKQNIDPMWKVLKKEVGWLGKTNIFPRSCVSGVHSKTMWKKQRYFWRLQNHVWITNFRGENSNTTMLRKYSYFSVVLRYGMSCHEMCGTILWVGKQDDSTTLQSIYSMHWWPAFQRRRTEMCRRHVESIIPNCSEMIAFGTHWNTWYSLVSEQTCTIDYKMDRCLCQKIISFDLLQSSHMWIQTVLFWRKHCQTMQLGTGTRFRLRGWSWGFKIFIRWNIVRFESHTFVAISWMCKQQTSVSHSSTESEIISLDARLRLEGIPALDFWDLIVAVLGNTKQNCVEQDDLLKNKREICSPPHTIHNRKQSQSLINELDNVEFIPSNVQSSHQEALLYVFEDNEAVIKMITKGRSPTMRHVSRTHKGALDWLFDRIKLDPKNQIGCSIESSWTPKTKSITSTPKTNPQTYLPREISDVMNGIIFCDRPRLAISVLESVLKWCRKEHKNIQVKKESQRNRDQWWIWSRDAAKGLLSCYLLLHQKAWRKPDMKVNFFWALNMSSIIERCDPW